MPWVWGWLGVPFFWAMPSSCSSISKALGPLRWRVVNTNPLSVNVDCGVPWTEQAARKASTTMRPVTGAWAVAEIRNREWSSTQSRTSASRPVASLTWVKSACQHSFGRSASNRIHERLGRLRGSGVITPARVRIRQIVVTPGGVSISSSRIAAIEWGPASQPSATSSPRRARILATTSGGVAFGLDRGRRDFGSSASQPPARQAATSWLTRGWETP